jgi:hypothetical protein
MKRNNNKKWNETLKKVERKNERKQVKQTKQPFVDYERTIERCCSLIVIV